jgi:recombination protein RecR
MRVAEMSASSHFFAKTLCAILFALFFRRQHKQEVTQFLLQSTHYVRLSTRTAEWRTRTAKQNQQFFIFTFVIMNFSSKLIEEAVNAFATLPGIGKKTALRLVLHLVNQDKEASEQFANAILKMRENIKFCDNCHNLSDTPTCSICADPRRNRSVVCVVESIRDVMAIEETSQYRGLYHVLGGVISPIEGIDPSDLNIDSLVDRVQQGEIREVIMAISPTIEGDTTIFYISKKLADHDVQVSTIARGVSFGGELEYADELTLGRSIVARVPYKTEE